MPASKQLKKLKKQPKYKTYTYYEKLFHIEIVLCVGDLDKHMAYIGKRFDSTHDEVHQLAGFFAMFEEKFKDGVEEIYVIYIKELDDFYTLSHELIHLCREVLVNRGIGVDLALEDETFAYLHTHLLQLTWKKMGAWCTPAKEPLKKKK